MEHLVVPRWVVEKLLRNYRRALRAEGLTTDDCETLMTLYLDALKGRQKSYDTLEKNWGVKRTTIAKKKKQWKPTIETLLTRTCGENANYTANSSRTNIRDSEPNEDIARTEARTLRELSSPKNPPLNGSLSPTPSNPPLSPPPLPTKKNPPIGGQKEREVSPSMEAPFTVREAEIYFEGKGILNAAAMAEAFFDYWEARAWTATDKKGNPVAITASTWRRRAATWKRNNKHYDKQSESLNDKYQRIFRATGST